MLGFLGCDYCYIHSHIILCKNEVCWSRSKTGFIHLSDFFNFLSLCGSNLDRIMPSQIKIKPRIRPHVEMKSESKSLGTKLKP